MFKDIFSFNGRIRRTEWGVSLIIYTIAYLIPYAIMLWAIEASPWGVFFCIVAFVPLVWFQLAQATKRCHDVGKSGWWQLIPFYSFIVIFIEGNKGDNAYGTDPKANK